MQSADPREAEEEVNYDGCVVDCVRVEEAVLTEAEGVFVFDRATGRVMAAEIPDCVGEERKIPVFGNIPVERKGGVDQCKKNPEAKQLDHIIPKNYQSQSEAGNLP